MEKQEGSMGESGGIFTKHTFAYMLSYFDECLSRLMHSFTHSTMIVFGNY